MHHSWPLWDPPLLVFFSSLAHLSRHLCSMFSVTWILSVGIPQVWFWALFYSDSVLPLFCDVSLSHWSKYHTYTDESYIRVPNLNPGAHLLLDMLVDCLRFLGMNWTRPLSYHHICSSSSVFCLGKWHHYFHPQLFKPESWEIAMFPPSSSFLTSNQSLNLGSYPGFSFSAFLTSNQLPSFISFVSKISFSFSVSSVPVSAPRSKKGHPWPAALQKPLNRPPGLLLFVGSLFYHRTVYSLTAKIRAVLVTIFFIVSSRLLGIAYIQ